MKHRFPIWLILTLGVVLSHACQRDAWLAPWDWNALFPVAHGELDLLKNLEDPRIAVAGDSVVHITLEEELFRIGLDSILEIPAYEIDTGFFVPFSITLPPGAPFFVQEDEREYDLGEAQLLYAELDEGNIEVSLSNTIDKPVLFQYFIYSATLDGDTFKVEERIEANSTLSKTYSLAGYALNLRGADGDGFNTVHTFFQAMIHPDETQNHQFTAGDKFNIVNKIDALDPLYVRGYFGEQSIQVNEKAPVDLFSQIQVASFDLFEFDVSLEIDNGFGADLSLLVEELSAEDSLSGAAEDLEHDLVGATQFFARAQEITGEVRDVKHIQKRFELSELNSNLDDLLEHMPNRISALMDLGLNPLGNVSAGNDFVLKGHDLTLTMEADVPLKLSMRGLLLRDTAALNVELPNELDRISSGALRLYLTNGYPLEAEVQGFLWNESGVVLDSLLTVPGAVAGAIEGGPQESLVEVPIDSLLLESLRDATHLIVRAKLNTTNGDSVAVKTSGTLAFKLIADLNLSTP